MRELDNFKRRQILKRIEASKDWKPVALFGERQATQIRVAHDVSTS